MNPEFPSNNPGAELEARLTAFILGELSAHESAALRQALDEDAELLALYERLKGASKLVREVAANPVERTEEAAAPLRLSEERRQKLLAQFKTVAPKEFVREKTHKKVSTQALEIAAVLVVIGLLASLGVPNFISARKTAQAKNAVINNLRQIDGAKQQWATENGKSPNDIPTASDLAPYMGRGETGFPKPIAGEQYNIGKVGESPTAELADAGNTQTSYEKKPSGRTRQISLDDNRVVTVTKATSPAPPPALAQAQITGNMAQSATGPTSVPMATAPPIQRPPTTTIVLPPAESSTELAQNATAAPNFRVNFSSPGYADKSASWNLGDGNGRTGGQVNRDIPIAHAKASDISMELTALGLRAGQLTSGSGGSGGSGGTIGRKVASITNLVVRAGSPYKLSVPQQMKPGQIDPATGLPIGPLPPDPSTPEINPATGLPVEPPQIKIHTKFADDTQTTDSVAGFNFNTRNFTNSGSLIASGGTQSSLNASGSLDTYQDATAYRQLSQNDGLNSPEVTTESGRSASTKDVATYFGAATNYSDGIGAINNGGKAQIPQEAGIAASRTSEFSDGLTALNTRNKNKKLLDLQAGHLPSSEAGQIPAWHTAQQSDERSDGYNLNAVDLTMNLGVPLIVSTNSVSSQDAFSTAADEAIRRQPDSITSNFIATNGAIGGRAYAATTDGITVTTDPESKRVFAITDGDSNQVADIVRQLDKKGAAEQTKGQSQAYLDKMKELENLRAAQEAMALKAAGHNVEYGMPTTLMVDVIEHADGKPAKKTLGESIGHIFTGKEIQTARIKIERDVTDVPGANGQPVVTGIYDPYFVQTESEVIQSEKILDQVIEQLKLKELWGKKEGRGPLSIAEAREDLKRSLEIAPARNTSLLNIKVKSGDAKEAAKIANTIAEVYQDYRKKQRQELAEGDMKALKVELAEQQKKIARVEDELAQLEPQSEQADALLRKPAASAPIPQPEISTADNAFSTFSLNVADVSFKLAAASLEKGQMPEPASIRSEEFINAFDYRDPAPAAGAPLGFAWERAQYPFAHNRDLLRFSVKTAAAGREAGKPMNIVLLLDKSGSMERADRVRIIHEALRVLAGQLQPQDKLSVVTFARVARLWVDGLSGSQAGEVVDGLDKLTPEGGTNLEEAMRLAYETARRHYMAGGINRVVLLTDGAANLGNVEPESLEQSVEAHRKEGIALDCFGVGWEGYNDDLLEELSRHGDGRYGFLNTSDDAANGFAKQLAGALHVAAADVKVQVEFNPKRVTSYRQIGYAKHQLTKEQFRDNTVDAAEISVEESGNALYTIEVNPNGEGPLATVHVRYRVPGTQDYPEHQWEVPYTGGATSLEQASVAMRLAGTASAFSEWLATSPFAGEVTMDKLLGLMSGVPENYGADERPKKLEWMIRQAKSLEGK